MSFISWNESFTVHVTEIDQQHKELVATLNELADAMAVGKGRKSLSLTLDRLIRYTEYHFTTEERYFAQFGYPEAEAHYKEHTAFVEKIADFQDKFTRQELSLSIEVRSRPGSWFPGERDANLEPRKATVLTPSCGKEENDRRCICEGDSDRVASPCWSSSLRTWWSVVPGKARRG